METNKRLLRAPLARAGRRVWQQLNLSEVIDGRENEAGKEEEEKQQQQQSRLNTVLAVNSIPLVVFKRGSRTPPDIDGSRKLRFSNALLARRRIRFSKLSMLRWFLKSLDLFFPQGKM